MIASPADPLFIGIKGLAQSGKDTVVSYLVGRHEFSRVSFATPIYEAIEKLNPYIVTGGARVMSIVADTGSWDRAKEIPEVRNLLQTFGTEIGRDILGQDVWVDHAQRRIKEAGLSKVAFSDVRFVNEAQFILAHKGYIIEVKRDFAGLSGAAGQHLSETEGRAIVPDYTVDNNCSFNGLYDQLDGILAEIARIRQAATRVTGPLS